MAHRWIARVVWAIADQLRIGWEELMRQHDLRTGNALAKPRRFTAIAVLAVYYVFSPSSSVIHAQSETLATRPDHDRKLSFIARQDFVVSGSPQSVAEGDLNGDDVL